MIVRVQLFAAAKEAADGNGVVEVEIPDRAEVRTLRESLVSQFADLRPMQSSLLIAVNGKYASEKDALSTDDEIACFPPVSGG